MEEYAKGGKNGKNEFVHRIKDMADRVGPSGLDFSTDFLSVTSLAGLCGKRVSVFNFIEEEIEPTSPLKIKQKNEGAEDGAAS